MLFGAEQAEITTWRGKVMPVTVLGGDRPGTCSATASISDHQPPEQARFLLARTGVTAAEGFLKISAALSQRQGTYGWQPPYLF